MVTGVTQYLSHTEVISRRSLQTVDLHRFRYTMETTKAAAVSLFQFVIRTTIGDHYPPAYTHYLPLYMRDKGGNPTPLIAHLTPRAGPTAPHPPQSGEALFIVKNEFKIKTQHACGGIHAYVSPQDHDLCPEQSAHYPIGTQVKAMLYNESWIQILGKADVPLDIKVRQVAMFSHAIPYWQDYGQRMQLVRDAEEAARPRPQLALPNAPYMGPAASYPDPLEGLGTPTARGPDGLAQLVAATDLNRPRSRLMR